jgi:DNA polymerase-3 subunit gamma/tau
VTRIKIVPTSAEDRSLAETERTRGRAFATQLSMRILSRTWQMLFKGLPEVQGADKPIVAAEMVLVRVAYAADLPSPDEVIRSLTSDNGDTPVPNGGGRSTPATNGNGVPQTRLDAPRGGGGPRAALVPNTASRAILEQPDSIPSDARRINNFAELVALAGEKRDLQIKTALERDIRAVRCEDGQLEIALEPGASKILIGELGNKISQWTGRRWMIVVSTEQGEPTVRSQMEARREENERGVRADPLVQAVLQKFPGAEIVAVRARDEPEPQPPSYSDSDEPTYEDMPPYDDEPPFEDR